MNTASIASAACDKAATSATTVTPAVALLGARRATPLNCAPIVCEPSAAGATAVIVAELPTTFAVPTVLPSTENVTVPPPGGGVTIAVMLNAVDAAMNGSTTTDVDDGPTNA